MPNDNVQFTSIDIDNQPLLKQKSKLANDLIGSVRYSTFFFSHLFSTHPGGYWAALALFGNSIG